MKRSILMATALLSMLFFAACYGNTNINENGVFTCANDKDCLDGFECKANFCQERQPQIDSVKRCKDSDGDGFGDPGQAATDYADCEACIKENRQSPRKQDLCTGKIVDCQPNDKTVNPDALEACNGKDDNCNGTIDEPVPCNSDVVCTPLGSSNSVWGVTVKDKGNIVFSCSSSSTCNPTKSGNTYTCTDGKYECTGSSC